MHVDTLIIGWGKAGKTLAGILGRAGRSVALVEQSALMVGGACINIACVPTKSLIHSAESRTEETDFDSYFADSKAVRDALTARLRAGNYAMLETVDEVTLVAGIATFTGPNTIEVSPGAPLVGAGNEDELSNHNTLDQLTITADNIVINTGSQPRALTQTRVTGAVGGRVHDSESLQHVSPLPRHLVVIGGGYVGLEFASMFGQFGTRVTVLDSGSRPLMREDADVSEHVVSALADAQVQFITGASARAVTESANEVTVRYVLAGPEGSSEDNGAVGGAVGGEYEITADFVLVAVGRQAATGSLNLEAAGVALDHHGNIAVNEYLRTNVPHIFAAGDVKGGPLFTYVSLDDSRIIADQIIGEGTRSTNNRTQIPYTLFTSPPLARVGITQDQAELLAAEQGLEYLVASSPVAGIAAMPRPKIVGDTRGVMKFVVDAHTDQILGAALMFVDSQEAINIVSLAMQHGITATSLRNTIYTHPSGPEGFNEVLGKLGRPVHELGRSGDGRQV